MAQKYYFLFIYAIFSGQNFFPLVSFFPTQWQFNLQFITFHNFCLVRSRTPGLVYVGGPLTPKGGSCSKIPRSKKENASLEG